MALRPAARWVPTAEITGPLTPHQSLNVGVALWVAGDVQLTREPCVAVVGSRRASEAGLRRSAKVSSQLAKGGVVVVSGLARGVDVAAHRACLKAGGRTIAVIGTPIESCYPPEHDALQTTLALDHLVISPFAPEHVTVAHDFAFRSRVMALLVQASVVVEADDRSGTSVHADEVLRLCRPLFIMRSLVEREVRWALDAIERGAIILDDVTQILSNVLDRAR